VIAIRQGVLVVLVAGPVALLAGALLSAPFGDDRAALGDAAFLIGGFPVGLAVGTVLVRYQARVGPTTHGAGRGEVG
jgi:hypothetical protein